LALGEPISRNRVKILAGLTRRGKKPRKGSCRWSTLTIVAVNDAGRLAFVVVFASVIQDADAFMLWVELEEK
jgi:hypothetical protein